MCLLTVILMGHGNKVSSAHRPKGEEELSDRRNNSRCHTLSRNLTHYEHAHVRDL